VHVWLFSFLEKSELKVPTITRIYRKNSINIKLLLVWHKDCCSYIWKVYCMKENPGRCTSWR